MFTEELADLHAYIKLFNKETTMPLKKVTKISTVCKVLSKKPTSKKCFLEIALNLLRRSSRFGFCRNMFQSHEKNQNMA